MSTLTVRRLLIDLGQPFERRWNGGDAFSSAFFNALSMTFPLGEQFFIDSVRKGVKALPAEQQAQFQGELQGFVGQEATHRRLHALFNEQLAAQGFSNDWARRFEQRFKRVEPLNVRHWVAITAANEHFTALFAEHLLRHPAVLAGAEPRLQSLWLWHSAEEAEHRSTAFDVYQALGGNLQWRRRWFRIASTYFALDIARQIFNNLWRDGSWWRASTWRSAARFLFGRQQGLVRHGFKPWLAYLAADFHPSQQGGELGPRWLAANQAQLSPVGTQAG
jgi:predicted metal-dependent hydrolase